MESDNLPFSKAEAKKRVRAINTELSKRQKESKIKVEDQKPTLEESRSMSHLKNLLGM